MSPALLVQPSLSDVPEVPVIGTVGALRISKTPKTEPLTPMSSDRGMMTPSSTAGYAPGGIDMKMVFRVREFAIFIL